MTLKVRLRYYSEHLNERWTDKSCPLATISRKIRYDINA